MQRVSTDRRSPGTFVSGVSRYIYGLTTVSFFRVADDLRLRTSDSSGARIACETREGEREGGRAVIMSYSGEVGGRVVKLL